MELYLLTHLLWLKVSKYVSDVWDVIIATVCLSLSFLSWMLPPLPFLCIRVAEWAEEKMDGWRPVVCYRDEQRSIIYGGEIYGEILHPHGLVSHVKAKPNISYLSPHLVLSCTSHMENQTTERMFLWPIWGFFFCFSFYTNTTRIWQYLILFKQCSAPRCFWRSASVLLKIAIQHEEFQKRIQREI